MRYTSGVVTLPKIDREHGALLTVCSELEGTLVNSIPSLRKKGFEIQDFKLFEQLRQNQARRANASMIQISTTLQQQNIPFPVDTSDLSPNGCLNQLDPPKGTNGCESQDGWCDKDPCTQNPKWASIIFPEDGQIHLIANPNVSGSGNLQLSLWCDHRFPDYIDPVHWGLGFGQLAHRYQVDCDNLADIELIAANDDFGDLDPGINLCCGNNISVKAGRLYLFQLDGYLGAQSQGELYIGYCPAEEKPDVNNLAQRQTYPDLFSNLRDHPLWLACQNTVASIKDEVRGFHAQAKKQILAVPHSNLYSFVHQTITQSKQQNKHTIADPYGKNHTHINQDYGDSWPLEANSATSQTPDNQSKFHFSQKEQAIK